MMEVTVNEWVPGAFVLEVKFELADVAVTNGTIPALHDFPTFSTMQYPYCTSAQGLPTHTIV